MRMCVVIFGLVFVLLPVCFEMSAYTCMCVHATFTHPPLPYLIEQHQQNLTGSHRGRLQGQENTNTRYSTSMKSQNTTNRL